VAFLGKTEEQVKKSGKPVLKLVGTDGNAFAVLGAAHREAKRAGWTPEQWKSVETEATSGDYDHLLQTIMKHFSVR
jgi:hypothetical protein